MIEKLLLGSSLQTLILCTTQEKMHKGGKILISFLIFQNKSSATSSGDQLMPCLSLCVVNQTLICSSGCFDAAVSQESSACVGYGNLLKDEMSVRLSSNEGLYLVVFRGTAIFGTWRKRVCHEHYIYQKMFRERSVSHLQEACSAHLK